MLRLLDLYNDLYKPINLTAASRSCKDQYERNILKLSTMLGRPAKVEDLSDVVLMKLAAKIVDSGKTPATANKVLSQLRALWEFAARRKLTKQFPTIQMLQELKREPIAWTKKDLTALFQSIKRQPGVIFGTPASLWWSALHSILWDTGLRIGAALRLTWTDIDWSSCRVLVRAETQKDKEDQRFKLHRDTMDLLRFMRNISNGQNELIFTRSGSYSKVWYHYAKVLEDAGLPTSRRDKFHKMRRSVASWFEAAGGNATELLGHTDRATTRHYLDKEITGQVQASDLLFRPLGNPSQYQLQPLKNAG